MFGQLDLSFAVYVDFLKVFLEKLFDIFKKFWPVIMK